LEATEFFAGHNAAYFAAVSAMSGHIIDATPKQPSKRCDTFSATRSFKAQIDKTNEAIRLVIELQGTQRLCDLAKIMGAAAAE
jgi:hypothetical protein